LNQEWSLRRVWRYQPGNKNPEIEGRQKTMTKNKDKKTNNDLQNDTQKTKDGAKRV
jgi:hypothetical protein